ncbi:hypothetical protein OSSY52_08460 [Tepiditoga spiralis]|uniref:DUF5723 domain-containing protein n=1 Tax=Tepiditoga spiralis TaxID=2108365 RepID=A0A7G1G3S7_9BACT|nr:hypothetical protein [Tepiditoga spiralis]BBE30705.1 hypothetical protein OSSY52_08460 [Tepiditoga spiralis]
MKKIMPLFFVLISTIYFSSARITTSKNFDYYFYNINTYDTPVYSNNTNEGIKNSFICYFPFKYENRIKNDFFMPKVRYENSSIKENLFRDIIIKNGDVFSFAFISSFKDTFFARFAPDLIMADTSYFLYPNMNFYNIDDFTKISVDFPRFSYLSLKEDSFEFILGRTQLSSGPLDYDLLLSNNAPYYDNMSLKVFFQNNIYYRFSMLSSVPFMSKEEYTYLFNHNIKEGYRNDFFNSLHLKNNNFEFSLNSLNHIGGKLPQLTDIFFKSNTGLFSINGKLSGYLNLYGEYAINYENYNSSFGIGIDKVFDFNSFKIRPYIEYYSVNKGIYKSTPYKSLFYRSIALSNKPGSRILFDYPFGFKYGENSNITTINLILGAKKGYFKIKYDFGNVEEKQLTSFDFLIKINLFYGNLEIGYTNLNFENIFSSFNINYTIKLDVGL